MYAHQFILHNSVVYVLNLSVLNYSSLNKVLVKFL